MIIKISDVIDSRKISGTLKYKRPMPLIEANPDWYFEYPEGVFNNYYTHYQYDTNLIHGNAHCYAIGNTRLMSVTFAERIEELIELPFGLPPPEYYSDSPQIYTHRMHIDAVITCTAPGSSAVLHELAVGDPVDGDYTFTVEVASWDYSIYNWKQTVDNIDISIPYALEVVTTLERRIAHTYQDGGADIFTAYLNHHDPQGLPPGEFDIHYVPQNYVLKFEVAGVTRELEAEFASGQAELYRYGLKDCVAVLSGRSGYIGWYGAGRDPECVATALMEWNGNASPQDASTLVTGGSSATIAGGLISLITDCRDYDFATGGVLTYSATCPAYPADFNVSVEDLDYQDVAANVSLMNGDLTGSANGAFLTKGFDGRWSITLEEGVLTDSHSRDDTGGPSGEYYALHQAGEITNPATGNIPEFGMDVPPPDMLRFGKFDDTRLEMSLAETLTWDDAVTFTVPDVQTILTFADYTWSASDGVTLSIVDGALHVVVASGAVSPKISVEPNVSFYSGRFIRCAYTGAAATLTIAGRHWPITSVNNVVDVLLAQHSVIDASQTAYDAAAPSWAWGILDPGEIIIDLKEGTYTFETLALVRNPVVEHRGITLRIHDAFVGDRPGHPRNVDSPVLVATPQVGDSEDTQRCRNRIGTLTVDGVVVGEIYATEHRSDPAGYGARIWHHGSLGLGSADFISPSGYVTVSINTPPADWSVTDDDNNPINYPAAWLIAGSYYGIDSVTVGWRPVIAKVRLPFGECGGMTYDIRKQSGSKIDILALQPNGTAAATVAVKRYKKAEDILDAVTEYTPGGDGHVITEALPQATCRWFTISAVSGYTITATGLIGSYAGYDVYLPRLNEDNDVIEPLVARVLEHNQSTGELTFGVALNDINVGAMGVVYIPYRYTVACGEAEIDVTLRARNITFARFITAAMRGLLFDPLDSRLALLFNGSGSGMPLMFQQ